ncbi:hypothetical protein PC118_g24352 [Phytophthora cactorum]|uniref:Uncharacterized protein n=1 Tax=Phytophthora cactorum TaxID=29920 RepID=A0A8T1ER61_9STRA|nr:hypothetical protein PC111_g24167 [Phytophthora cactorum]KAG2956701.1 hypothetical protein PC118_g24352 [Phytophthora cactorum]KAG2968114.1 hypothetical protein PC120_g26867 [Phytophthora cactorum]KAG3034342.1 hypothetical protein PC121_g24303 [Phytophthora cactorum]
MGYVDVFRRGCAAVPSHSWSVLGPKANLRSVYSMEIPHLNLKQEQCGNGAELQPASGAFLFTTEVLVLIMVQFTSMKQMDCVSMHF